MHGAHPSRRQRRQQKNHVFYHKYYYPSISGRQAPAVILASAQSLPLLLCSTASNLGEKALYRLFLSIVTEKRRCLPSGTAKQPPPKTKPLPSPAPSGTAEQPLPKTKPLLSPAPVSGANAHESPPPKRNAAVGPPRPAKGRRPTRRKIEANYRQRENGRRSG